MTKADLIAEVATDADITKAVAEKVLNAFMDTIEKALKKGDKITLTGFGTFQCARRAARTGRNPRTGNGDQHWCMQRSKVQAGQQT